MATITLSVAAMSKSWTVSAGDITRIVNAFTATYGQVPNGSGGLRDRTSAEVFDLIASDFIGNLKDRVRSIEGSAASAAVTPVSTT